MTNSLQLILTHGTTDLQILLQDTEGRCWRAAPDKTIVRRFHQWLLNFAADAEVIDIPADLHPREAEASFTDWDGDTFGLWLRDSSPDAKPVRDTQGCLQLVLPKIAPALQKYLAQCVASVAAASPSPMAAALQKSGIPRSPLLNVLVLSTDRSTDDQEPIATFTFLQRWLVKQGVPAKDIQEEVFLREGEMLESPGHPVSPAIVRRLEDCLYRFIQPKTTVLLATTGGIPLIKPLLAELAALLSGGRARNLFRSEQGESGLIERLPQDVVRVRRQCLELVSKGALLEAWFTAAPYHGQAEEERWLLPLQQAANLINGNPVKQQEDTPAMKLILENIDRAAALLIAIRVESALHGQRWLEAMNGTMTFMETALGDAISKWDIVAEFNARTRKIRFKDINAIPPVLLQANPPLLKPWRGEQNPYRANLIGESLKQWTEYLGLAALKEFNAALYDPIRDGRPVDFRNYATHGVLSQDEINRAIQVFVERGLWAKGLGQADRPVQPGQAFIGRGGLTCAVLQTLLGSDLEPLTLYKNLIDELVAVLHHPHVG